MTESKPVQVIKVKKDGPKDSKDREEVRDILLMVLKKMVSFPESVNVFYVVGERTTVYKVDCCKEDLGRVLGSRGKNISGLRAVVAAMTAMSGIRSIIEIPYFPLDSQCGE